MTEEEFQAWRHSPATGPFLKHLHAVRERLKEQWALGVPLGDKAHAIAMVYGDILDLEYERDIAPEYEVEGKEEQDAE